MKFFLMDLARLLLSDRSFCAFHIKLLGHDKLLGHTVGTCQTVGTSECLAEHSISVMTYAPGGSRAVGHGFRVTP